MSGGLGGHKLLKIPGKYRVIFNYKKLFVKKITERLNNLYCLFLPINQEPLKSLQKYP